MIANNKKHKDIIFHKINFKNAQRFNKFCSSKELFKVQKSRYSPSHNNFQKSQSLKNSELINNLKNKKAENKNIIRKTKSLFKPKKYQSTKKLDTFTFKNLIINKENIIKKEEKKNKNNGSKELKSQKILNKLKLERNKNDKGIKKCKTFCNNNINKENNEQNTNYNNNSNKDKNEIKAKNNNDKQEKRKSENFVNIIKKKFLCCL